MFNSPASFVVRGMDSDELAAVVMEWPETGIEQLTAIRNTRHAEALR